MGARISAIGGLGLVSILRKAIVGRGFCRGGETGGIFCRSSLVVLAVLAIVAAAVAEGPVVMAGPAEGAEEAVVMAELVGPRVLNAKVSS